MRPVDVPILEVIRRWHRLATEYEADCRALMNEAGPIALALRRDQICRIDADLFKASFYLAYFARRTGIHPISLLRFARCPNPTEGLAAARLVVDQLLIAAEATGSGEESPPRQDELLTLDHVRRYIPGKPSYSTIHRWATKGCGGAVLESWVCGGTACTTLSAIERFSAAIAAKRIHAAPKNLGDPSLLEDGSMSKDQPESRQAELQQKIEALDRAGF